MGQEDFPLADPLAVQDVFADELTSIEQLAGAAFRFTFTTRQKSPIDGSMERVIVHRLIMPAPSISQAVMMTLTCIGAQILDCAECMLALH